MVDGLPAIFPEHPFLKISTTFMLDVVGHYKDNRK
jgi:hypothetical protein